MTQPHVDELAHALREFALSLVRDAPQSSLSRTAAATLSVLERLGPQRITSLAEHESVTQPAMTGLVHRLEAGGLVTRRPDPVDGRACLIAITEIGAKELWARRDAHDAAIAARLQTLPPYDRALLAAAAPAITRLMESHV
ncbi:MarR family winged helix-turn-helix transcriptional regulator [Aeromicrobium chenweiae]|uniref:MarR family transcriptional regulator n=1 Tax=Aeromicrobium chenweiae TaxID=2079793 RepID=A0A2S0WMV9_9ACTN|nr:MarR family transcriptional regulator [Aeromicrobium chenweiae]AWB92647.1 MarR family transcriptional regulator [Aeromicrobium chenweiae]TGN33635.1 MarR family transcriptional regulator [Aeromicrobium chenweiae]